MTEWTEALTDGEARRARREVSKQLALSLAGLGSETRKYVADPNASSRPKQCILAAGLTSAIGCELVSGAVVLASNRCAYGAAALVRQLVEIEYLAWAIGNDPDDAIDWLKSTKQQRMAKWQPGKIRGRADGRFPNSDYSHHCEAGGHPTPEGARIILDNRDVWVEVALYETAYHGANAWHYLIEAFHGLNVVVPEPVEAIHRILDNAIGEWRRVDHLTGLPSV